MTLCTIVVMKNEHGMIGWIKFETHLWLIVQQYLSQTETLSSLKPWNCDNVDFISSFFAFAARILSSMRMLIASKYFRNGESFFQS